VTVETLDQARERLRPYVKCAKTFTGWTAYVHNRPLGPRQPWDYMERARKLIADATSVLDMGTGGGERFGELLKAYVGRAVSTEEWHVNVPLAAEHLRPLGSSLVWCRSVHLPFASGSFDLVLNRHEELDPVEVARVLRPGGRFLTQQVWRHWKELSRYIPRTTDFGDHFHTYQVGLRANSMQVLDAREHEVAAAYDNLGDFVFMLCIAPWTIPDFDPLGSDLESLLELERELTTADGLVLADGSYIIEAWKPS
jgi:SAM-dependent methyltransferase